MRLRLLRYAGLLELLAELWILGDAGMAHRRPEQARAVFAERQHLGVLKVVAQAVFPKIDESQSRAAAATMFQRGFNSLSQGVINRLPVSMAFGNIFQHQPLKNCINL